MCGCKCWLLVAILVAALAWIFRFQTWQWYARKLPVPPVSYDGRILFNLDNLHKPDSESEIVQLITDANQNGRKVRVLGDGHSWSEIAQTQDIMISLIDYQGLVGQVDADNMEATFKAGTPLRTVSETLDAEGYAMIQLGSVAGQSIAGAISTGTHGSGLTIGNIAALVTKLRIVDGTGKVHDLSEADKDNKDFKAAQVSVGMLGVVTQVTFRVKPKFTLEETRTPQSLQYCLDNMKDIVENSGNKYVKFWVEFYNDFCALYNTNATEKKETHTPLFSFLTYYSFAISTRITYLLPSLTKYLMWAVNQIGLGWTSHRIENSYLILNDHFELPIHQEGEVIVAYKDCVETVKTIKDVIIRENHPVNYITEVRFIAGDDMWLSPSYGHTAGSCAVTLTIYADEKTVLKYFNDVYLATKTFNARFHWGKYYPNTTSSSSIKELYTKFSDFKATRKRFDPNGVFLNTFLKEKFGFSEK